MSERTPQPPRRVFRAIREHPWAMLRSHHEMMLHVIDLRMQGIRRPQEEIQAAVEAAARPQTVPISTSGSIAILSLTGILAQRMDMFVEISGGTSLDRFSANFRQALADPNITTILLDCDSPGGSVFGVQETADLVYNARGQGTEIIAVANSMAASACYWIATQADRLVVTPGGEVGSVGVICMHENMAAMDEMMGVECTYLTYPESGYKAEGNPHEPLSEEARAYLKSRLAEYGEAFEGAVARGRGLRVARVQREFGRGRMVGAKAAVSLGMADQVATMQEMIDKLTKKKSRGGGSRALVEYLDTSAGEMRTAEMEVVATLPSFATPADAEESAVERIAPVEVETEAIGAGAAVAEPEESAAPAEIFAEAPVAVAVVAKEEVAVEAPAAIEEDDGETTRLVALARLRLAGRRVA